MANNICQNFHCFKIVTITSVTPTCKKLVQKYSKILTCIQIWQ